ETDLNTAAYVMRLGEVWGKEPTLLKKDIRGFITNRLMYAVYREALTLIEKGETSLEDADKIFRYDVGSWITVMGIFRRLDFIGFADYVDSFGQLLKKLSNRTDLPKMMESMIIEAARGIHNCHGLYMYDEKQAKAWEEAFARFNKDIYELAANYREQQPTEVKQDEKNKLSKI